MSRWIYRRATLLALSFGLVACEQGQSADPLSVPSPTSPALALTSPDTVLQLSRGWNTFVTLNVARTSSAAGSVALRCDSVPNGMEVTLASSTLPAAASGTRLMVDVDTLIAPGDYTFIVRATADGVAPASLRVRVTVPRPSFELLVTSTSLTITQALPNAGTLSFAALTRRDGFRGDVTLRMEGLPQGILPNTFVLRDGMRYPTTVSFSGSPVPPWPSVGSGTLTFRASARDAADQIFTLPFVVAPAPPELAVAVVPTSISIARNGSGRVAIVIALRRGLSRVLDGLWVTGLPAGVVAIMGDPDDVDGEFASLDLQVAGDVLPGTYPIMVHGRLTGTPPTQPDASATLTLSVR